MSTIFNLDLLTHDSINTKNILEDSNIEESYFVSTLNFISEAKSEYRQYSIELHKNILESTDYYIINESFSDFFEKVKEIISKLLKFIASLFDRFILSLNKLIKSDKYILKNKDLLKKFSSDHNFDIEGYYYTFDPSIPLINAQAEFTTDFIQLDFDMFKDKNSDHIKYISNQLSSLDKLLKDDYYDIFRGQVIGKEYKIYQEDFAEELFQVFRNDYSKKDTITINRDNILSSLQFFENYKDFEKSVKKTKDKIDKEYREIEKRLQGLIYRSKDNDIAGAIGIGISSDYDNSRDYIQSSEEVYSKLNLFIKSKITQVMEMSNIHSMAFSYKLDAIIDCFKQDKEILYKGINMILKDSNI